MLMAKLIPSDQLSGGGATGGNITLGTGGALTVNQFTFGDFAGVISGDGSFTKSSYGVLKLSSANTYTGATAVTGGDLIIMINGGIPNTALSLTGSSRLLLLKDGLSINVGTLSGDAGALAWLYPNSVLTINQTSDATFAGTITDNTFGSVVKTGTGTLTLSGSNTYQGATTVNAGALSLAANNAIASSVSVTLANTANVALNINGTTQTIGTLIGGGASGGNVNLGSGGGALTISQKTFSDYTGVIGGTGSFTKSGPGVLRLNGASTYTGNTTLSSGEIIIGATNALPTSSALSFTGASRLLLIEQNVSQQFSSLTSTFGVSGVSIFGYKTGGFNLSQSGNSNFYGDLVGAFSFAKSGSGTITLSGARGALETITAGAIN